MPHHVDVYVGKKIRQLRWVNGMTQQQLAERIGVKFQQVQKYETGANRISASRLFDTAACLNVEVSCFFEKIKTPTENTKKNQRPPLEILESKEANELVRAFYQIPKNQRQKLFDLASVLGGINNEELVEKV